MARALLLLLAVAAALPAGCFGGEDAPPPDPSDSANFQRLPPREVLSEEGNNAQCTEVLSGEVVLPFDVHEGYDAIEVQFHASGLGRVGYEIRSASGDVVASVEDYNPTSQPCDHAHDPAAQRYDVAPGAYEARVRQLGILGWILIVNEVAPETSATASA